MTLLGLIGDVHAAPAPVAEALELFTSMGVERVLCTGDIAGYMDQLEQTVALLEKGACITVVGNHDLSYLEKTRKEPDSHVINYLKNLPASYETEIEGKSLYMVHAQPPDECHGGIKLLNKDGVVQEEWLEYWAQKLSAFQHDVLVVGHTHQVFAEYMGDTLVVNPGSSVFNNCCAVLRLPEMTVEMFSLSNSPIQRTWNWGEHVIYSKKN